MSSNPYFNIAVELSEIGVGSISLMNNLWATSLSLTNLIAKYYAVQNATNEDDRLNAQYSLDMSIIDVTRNMGFVLTDTVSLIEKFINLTNVSGVDKDQAFLFVTRITENSIYVYNHLLSPDPGMPQTVNPAKVNALIADLFALAAIAVKHKLIQVGLNLVAQTFTTIGNYNKLPDGSSLDADVPVDQIMPLLSANADVLSNILLQNFSPIKAALDEWIPEGVNPWHGNPEHFIGDMKGIDKNDSYTSGSGNDTLYGLTGTDTLYGSAGNDYIDGGDGDDYLYGGLHGDVLVGGKGEDYLYGDEGHDVLYGRDDDDHLYGGLGNDRILGGAGNDYLDGEDGSDYLNGEQGNDTLRGGSGNDFLLGGDGQLDAQGGSGNDYIYADRINPNITPDVLNGDTGNDIIYGFNGENHITGGSGNDLIYGGNNLDMLVGGQGNDVINGSGGNNHLFGEDGNDYLIGGDDVDRMLGGAGADRLVGGSGNDIYYYDQASSGTDTILDSDGQGRIDLNGYTLAVGSYDEKGQYWNSSNGLYKIRKVGGAEGRTTIIVYNKKDIKNTIFIENWQNNGDLGLTFSTPVPYTIESPNAEDFDIANGSSNIITDLTAVKAGAGNDYVAGTTGTDNLYGGDGNDFITSGTGADKVYGDAGDDIILGGLGSDIIHGGTGGDLVLSGLDLSFTRGSIQSMVPVSDGSSDQLEESYDVLDFYFTPKFDTTTQSYAYFVGQSSGTSPVTLPSIATGLNANDTQHQLFHVMSQLTSPIGSEDTFDNELYEYLESVGTVDIDEFFNFTPDIVYGDAGNDFILGAGGADYLDGGADNDYLFGRNGDDQLFGQGGVDRIYGGDGRDYLAGGEQNDLLGGGYDADVMYGGGGDDHIIGDVLNLIGTNAPPSSANPYRYGDDLIYGDAGNDNIWGGGGNDYLYGGNDKDYLEGEEGDDYLFGNQGIDTLRGGDGNDYLLGGTETDYLFGDSQDDYLSGEEGDDQLQGQQGNDILEGGIGSDRLFGGTENDILRGGDNKDDLYGEAGDDTLQGGTGNDSLHGGSGSDIYVFNIGDGIDSISEEQNDIRSLNYNNYVYFAFDASQIRQVQRDQFDLVVSYGVSDQVRVKDYYKIRNTSSHTYLQGYEEFETIEISEFRFEDGTVWNTQDIMQMAPPPEVNELPPDSLEGVIYFVDALVDRDTVKVKGKTTITYTFPAEFAEGQHVKPYYVEQAAAVQQALSKYSEVLNIQFVLAAEGQEADLNFYLDDLTSADAGAAAGYASAQTGDIHMNSLLFTEADSMNPGSQGFEALLHEIGHALGLKHPFEAPVLPADENNQNNTVMSYTSNGINDVNLQVFDIAALQYLHGINLGSRTGNTVYTFDDKYIWDSAGIDTFDASAQEESVSIDLNAAGWSYIGEKNASILAAGQSFIGYGTKIENAIGGSGDDALISNQLNNVLQGGTGRDSYKFTADNAHDKIIEVDNNNKIEIAGLGNLQIFNMVYAGQKIIYGSSSIEFDVTNFESISINNLTYTAQEFVEAFSGFSVYNTTTELDSLTSNAMLSGDANIDLTGNAKNNKLLGNGGNNTLDGGSGIDTLSAGSGDDTYIVDHVDDQVIEFANQGNDKVISSVGWELSENVEDLQLTGTMAIQAKGNELVNRIEANSANNIIDGGAGADRLTGMAGDDTYYVDNTYDTLIEIENEGVDSVISNVSFSLAVNIENLKITGNAEYAWGNGLDNVLVGNNLDNSLNGSWGDDTLEGGGGADTLVGGYGNDSYVFGKNAGLDTIDDGVDATQVNFLDANTEDIQFIIDSPVVNPITYYVLGESWTVNSLEIESRDLTIAYGVDDKVRVKDFFDRPNGFSIKLANGDVWTKEEVLSRISNTMIGNDTITIIKGHNKAKNIIRAGTNNAVTIYGGNRDDTVYGGSGDDTIYGLDGNDIIYSGLGHDYIDAGNGNNVVFGEAGNDSIVAGTGNQQISGGEGNDQVTVGDGNHVISGNQGDDNISAGKGNHTIHGNAGDDTIYAGQGQQQIYADAGNDVITLNQFSGFVSGGDGQDRISLSSTDNQTVYSDAGNDFIEIIGDNNTLDGGEGNDILTATGNNNILKGGVGYDSYNIYGGKNAKIYDDDLIGSISIAASKYYKLDSYNYQIDDKPFFRLARESETQERHYYYTKHSYRFNDLVYDAATHQLKMLNGEFDPNNSGQQGVFAIQNVTQSQDLRTSMQNMQVNIGGFTIQYLHNEDNVFLNTTLGFNDFLDQGSVVSLYAEGNDIIYGISSYARRRELYAERQYGDIIYAGSGNDTINTGAGSNQVYAGDGDDYIIAPDQFAIDELNGGDGNDIIYTYDPLNPGSNLGLDDNPYIDVYANQVHGSPDFYMLDIADTVYGGAGDDQIYLGKQLTTVYGGAGNDTITTLGLFEGYNQSHMLYGEEGNDTLIAGEGGAYLDGGEGADYLVGGLGNDTFIVDEFDTFEENDPEGGYDTLHIAQSVDLSTNYFEAVTLLGEQDLFAKGNAANNELFGNDGNNLLDGRAGSDTMSGGLGDDYYVVDVTDTVTTDEEGNAYILKGDQVNEEFDAGIDTLERWQDDRFIGEDGNGNPVVTGSYRLLQDNIENLVLKGNAKTAFGNDLDNIIYGNAQNNYMNGLGGNDTYVFAKGGATDSYSFNDDIDAVNTLKITGYDTSDVYARRGGYNNQDVYFSFKGTDDHIWLSNYYVADSGGRTNKLDQIEFDSGVIWTQADIQVLVDRAATNRAPTVTGSIPQIIGNQGTSLNYTIASNVITDPDTWDSLNYKVTLTTQTSGQYNPIPSWLTFDPITRTLSGTPPSNVSGTTTFYFWGTDMYGQGAGTSFTLKVNPPNRAPVVANAIADQTVTDGKAFSYTIAANAFTDPDADPLTYTATLEDGSALPAWLSFNASTRVISGTSPDNSLPLNIKISAKDSGNLVVSDVFKLTFVVQNLTVNGTTGVDTLYGGSGNDTITGQGGNDTLYGQSGNDSLDGGTGNDSMYGGKGDDTYTVDSATDVVNENANEGTDTVKSSVTLTLTNANVENLTLTGTSAINATGNSLNNMLIGNSGNNTLTGGAGDDWLDGAAGTNTLVGGTGNDTYVLSVSTNTITELANEGADTVQSAITYTLGATSNLENLTLTGTTAINATGNSLNNTLIGNSGNNTLTGGAGDDWLDGAAGTNTLVGGTGNDTYVLSVSTNTLTELANEGTDSVQSAVTYTLGNNMENLTLTGTSAINATGNTLANVLKGNSANNTLTGGTGNDTYQFDRNSAIDTIVENDATSGNKDILSFAGDIAADQLWFVKSGNNLEVSVIGTSNKAIVKDWYLGNAYHVEELKSGNGKTLLDSQVQNLVSAMAGLTPPAGGQTTLSPEYQAQLNAVITANWQ